VEHLYLPHHKAGRCLISIENLFYRKLALMAHHLLSLSDSLVQLCSELNQSLPPHISIHFRAKNYCSSLSRDAKIISFLPTTLKQAICGKQLSLLIDPLTAKPLHGKYSFLASSDVDKADSTRWLRQHLYTESESTIFAIQDQVIATRIYEAKIMCKNVPSLKCRICDKFNETIVHLLSACPQLAATSYCIAIILWYIGTFQKFFHFLYRCPLGVRIIHNQ